MYLPNHVGYLEDEDIQKCMDDAILASATHLSTLLTMLFEKGFRPVGQMPTLLFSIAHFCNAYETLRMDGGEPLESFELAQALTLKHPVMQRLISEQIAGAVNRGAGVNEQ